MEQEPQKAPVRNQGEIRVCVLTVFAIKDFLLLAVIKLGQDLKC